MRYIIAGNCEEEKLALEEAVAVLHGGGIVGCLTETFYALCAKYDDNAALEYLFQMKGRKKEMPFPLIIGREGQLEDISGGPDGLQKKLIERFWPGPLTLLFRAKEGLSGYLVKDGKVAVRIPGESFALKLARVVPFPLTATSANISGMPPARTAAELMEYFDSRIEMLVDSGESHAQEPSTIVDTEGGRVKVLREGAIRLEEIEALRI